LAVRDVNHDANVIAELDATCMSSPRGAMQPSARPMGRTRYESYSDRASIRTLARFVGDDRAVSC